MKKRYFLLLFLILKTTFSFSSENWQEDLFKKSPRLEYLRKELLKRFSTYKLITTSPEKVSNPILFREALIYSLDDLEIEKTKFFILKELFDNLALLKQKDKEISLFKELKESFSQIPSLYPETTPQAMEWLRKEKEILEKEIEDREKEKSFYLSLLKEKFNLHKEIESEEIFDNLKIGFEKEIMEKKKELLEWDKNFFQERKDKYPHTIYYLIIPTNFPYTFFSFPLPLSIDKKIYSYLYERDRIEIEIEELKNELEEERIGLRLYYIQKRKEILKEILEKIKETKGLSLSFEEFSSLEKICLETFLALINLEREEDLLKKELLRYNLNPLKIELNQAPSLPQLDYLIDFTQENSLSLKKIERELMVIKELISATGQNYGYLSSLDNWLKCFYEEEKDKLIKELFQNWCSLFLAQKRQNLQKEIFELTHSLYNLALNSPLYNQFDKKIKEIEVLKQKMSLLEREEEVYLSWLGLKETIKTSDLENIPFSSYEELDIDSLYKKYFPHKISKKKEIIKNLLNEELKLLAKGEGRVFYPSKESLLKGEIFLPFRLEINPQPPLPYLNRETINLFKEYLSLKEQLEKEQEEKERSYNQKILQTTQRRIQYLEELSNEQGSLLKELEKKISPDIKERIIQQKIKILSIKDEILEKKQIYIKDLISLETQKKLSLYKVSLLLEKIYPVLHKERASLLSLIKSKKEDLINIDSFYTLKNLDEWKGKVEKIGSLFEEIFRIFILKERLGLISSEELRDLSLIKNKIEEEIYQIERKILHIKKKEFLGKEISEIDIDKLQKLSSSLSREEIIKNDPFLKLLNLEIEKFSPQEINLLTYLYKEREEKIKEIWRDFPKTVDFYNYFIQSLEEKEKICKEELENIFQDFKEERIGIYGAYSLSSAIFKYIEEQKNLYKAKDDLKDFQIKFLDIVKISPFQFFSLSFPKLDLLWKKITFFKFNPNFMKEREKRREEFILKNYAQKTHALNFLKNEREKEENIKERRELFKKGHEKESKVIEFLDKLWDKEKESRERIRKKIVESGIDIKEEILPLKEILSLNEEKKEILELIFINYAKRFRKEENIKNYLIDLKALFLLFPLSEEEIEKLSPWWAKYISPLLPYPEKTQLEEIIDPRILGLYLYYVEIKNFLGLKDIQDLQQYIEEDKQFLFLEPHDIPLEKIETYLNWEAKKKEELGIFTFLKYSKKEWEEKRKEFLRNTRGLFGYTYGSLRDKNLQKEIIDWLITLGIEEKEYPLFMEIVEKVIEEIKKFSPPLSREEKISMDEGIRLRWLYYKEEFSLLEEEEKKIDEGIFIGNILSWSEFFWENKIKKEEIPLFFSFMERLKRDPIFTDIYGRFEEIDISRKNLYTSFLSYWAEKWLNFYRREPQESELKLKNLLYRFKLVYSLPSFQNLYGPLELTKINPKKYREKKILREFMHKMGFFLDWSNYLSLDDEETKIFFENLYNLFLHKEIIEKFYKNQNIELAFDLNNYEEKEEFLGIIINWLQFFYFRGIKNGEEIINALKEIEIIQDWAKNYQLNFTIDEIRYWWEKAKIKDWDLEFIRKIFSNISQIKKLIPEVCNDILKDFYPTKPYPLKEEFIKIIEDKKNCFLKLSEIYNLAERFMPIYNLSYEELKNYYKEKICLETFYYLFNKEKISPQDFFQLYSLMKEKGYSLKEMEDFLFLYSLIRKNKTISKTNPSDLEVYGLLNHIFKQIPPYEQKFSLWENRANLLIESFYKEHSRYIDFSLLKALIDYSFLRMRPWQIKLIIEKGALSKNSPDIEICDLVEEKDWQRYILRISWENLKETISEEEMKLILDFTLGKEEARINLKKLFERYALFQNEITNIIIQKYYERKISPQEIFLLLDKDIKKIRSAIFKKLLPYLFSEREKIFKEKQEKLLSLEKPPLERRNPSQPFSKRKFIQREIVEKTRNLYAKELPPHKSSSLVWKVLEGLSVEKTLKIYIKDYQWIEELYKRIFSKENLDFEDYAIINYFSEEINFSELNNEMLVEIFLITKEIRECFQKFFHKEISILEAIDYTWSVFHSGGDPEIVEEIFNLASDIYELIGENRNEDLIFILLYQVGKLYNIEIGKELLFVYPFEKYIEVIKEVIDYFHIEKTDYKKIERLAKKMSLLLHPPTIILSIVRKTEFLYRFIKKYYKEIPKKEIFVYLDLNKKESINFLNLKEIFYENIPDVVIIQDVESALSFAFKNFLKDKLL